MKALVIIAAILIFVVVSSSVAVAAPIVDVGPHGSAPNAGDGIPDGSGMNDWLNGGPGPAPNSGDGIPDGSGF